MEHVQAFFESWQWSLIDLTFTTYLVYYYVTNEIKKDKENNNV